MSAHGEDSLRILALRLLLVTAASLVLPVAVGQQCSSRCPPLDGGGNEVPSLCPGDDALSTLTSLGSKSICHPSGTPATRLDTFYEGYDAPNGPARFLVVGNFFVGCNAGRREANIYSYTSTMIHERYPNVVFMSSLKGSSCRQWASMYASAGAISLGGVDEVTQPLTVDDSSYVLRDAFFTSPYPHPSYVIIDYEGRVRYKFVGPCCGYSNYFACSTSTAMSLNTTMWTRINTLMAEVSDLYGGSAPCFFSEWASWSACSCPANSYNGQQERSRTLLQKAIGSGTCGGLTESQACFCADPVPCEVSDWSPWSDCSMACGSGEHYRTREITTQPAFGGEACPDELVELGTCEMPACQQQCVPELGQQLEELVIASSVDGLRSPRDVAFSPKPGFHLGNFSSGQVFPTTGPEAWIANGHDHSITIIAGAGRPDQKALTRYDRGWYHYMINITALSFNMVSDSGRLPDQDTYAFFATCQDNNNDYNGRKQPNFFMGPSLYSSSPEYKNLVRHDGGPCTASEECFLLHSDMLHESPSCPGIVHDPETQTAYGSIFWAIDGVNQQLVRYDFQQPHGPGLMDHSFAAVRRYPEVPILRGPPGVHHGMAIDATERKLYVVSPGSGEVLRVSIDSGSYARTAREEYPIFSSRLPSFEYSIYLCVDFGVFASGLHTPSGLALTGAGQLFVAEYDTSDIRVFDVATGFEINRYSTSAAGLMGLRFAPGTGRLFGVAAHANQLLEFKPTVPCATSLSPYKNPNYVSPIPHAANASEESCVPNATIPSAALFDQVHTGSGYDDDDDAVQDDGMVDESAALLAFRRDCDNASLNFDAFLLGGFLCHVCLPDNCGSRDGGVCTNIQWDGYTCDNEIRLDGFGGNFTLDRESIVLQPGRTYRIIVNSPGMPVYVALNGIPKSSAIESGTLTVLADAEMPDSIIGPGGDRLFSIASTVGPETSTSTTVSFTPGTRGCLRMSRRKYDELVDRGIRPSTCTS